MKILFVASYCDGLGHLNRMTCIAKEIKKINSRHKILFLTVPEKDVFLKNNFQYVEVPLSEKTYTETGFYPDLDVRASSEVIRKFKPDVIVFDTHFPLSLLRIAKLKNIKTVVILRKTKENYFNKIIKLKGIDLFIFPHEKRELEDYIIPKGVKAAFAGPIIRKFDGLKIRDVIERYGIKEGDFVVTFTAGSGGGDETREFIYAATDIYKKLNKKIEKLKFIVLTGLYFKEKINAKGILMKKFEQESINLMRASNLVVAIAGYNTCNEIILAKKPSILIPANRVNENQREKAEYMKVMGMSMVLKDVDEEKIANCILKYKKYDKIRGKMEESFSKIHIKTGNMLAAQKILHVFKD